MPGRASHLGYPGHLLFEFAVGLGAHRVGGRLVKVDHFERRASVGVEVVEELLALVVEGFGPARAVVSGEERRAAECSRIASLL